jgi:hypothetical protein
MTDWARAADLLIKVAACMEEHPDLDPNGAIRLVVFGYPDASVPDGGSDESEMYDDAARAIESGYAETHLDPEADGLYISDVPTAEAITAARMMAERFRVYAQ